MNLNVVLPLCSSLVSFVFFAFLIDQWQERRRPYQLVWAIGMLWYGLSAGTEFLGGAVGWSEPLYRTWYLIGAIWVAAWLGLGTAMLLARTRFGFAVAASFVFAGLFTWLSWAKYHYPDSGIAPVVYGAVALGIAVVVAVLTARRDERWSGVVLGATVIGSAAAAILLFTAPLAAGSFVDPATHIPTGTLLPGYVRLLTPFFNVTGAFTLVFGGLYSSYVFMPKRRIIRYSLGRDGRWVEVAGRRWHPSNRGAGGILGRLVIHAAAVVAVVVNFIASLPGAIADLARGRLNSRVPATLLIAAGALVPAITSGANRFGSTSGFFVGELIGVCLLFAGFLVSVEVFREIRIPFTHIVLRAREVGA